ncbi:hypothetical protein GQX73_g814 [Xylaria multiplex]|uniref:Uncharacterized protein n=1 Tax=Xylaria multiplex TaxID=323545 RepID=A0A7C8IZB6_9PEZI|nr:hypothetical protein GQX73_g814 [Xylaria multiplex]
MDYKKLYEEAERRRQEAERREQEAVRSERQLRIQAEQRRREEVQSERQLRLEAERKRKEAEYDATAVNTALRAEREENARITLDRTMEAYLIDIDGMNNHLQRLTPLPVKRSNTLSEGQKSQSSTSGRTILNKYYPLKICPWDDFRYLYQDAFERARAVIGNSSRFPSVLATRATKESMDDQLPPAFLESESFRNEAKTSYILHEALQRPAQYVMNAYLDAVGSQMQLYFDNRSAGWQVRTSNSTDMIESEASSSMQGDNESSAGDIAQKLPRKTQPDCLVLASVTISPTPKAIAEEQEEQAACRPRSVYRLVMGEHKPMHRLRATAVPYFNQTPLPENIMIQLAKAKNGTPSGTRRGRAQAGLDADEAHILDLLPGQVYFANALTQTFHYMVTSGVKYGYLASGETLTLLKLSQDDPTTLLIHSEVFPQNCRTTLDEPSASRENTGNIRDLPVSLLCGLCLLAYESTPEPARQRSINVSQLALFPKLPPSLSLESSSSRGSSARGRRRRRDDDDDNDSNDEDNNREDRGGYKSPSNASSSSASRLCPPAYQPRVSSPLKRQRSASHQSPEHQATNSSNVNDKKKRRIMLPSLPSPFDPSTFRPIRPYCTQACLRGLVQDEGVDYSCPNVLLHLEAQRRACRLKGPRWGGRHAITVDELRELVQHQLLENVELDCQCLLEDGARGAIGCLFKITVTGFGYTLVAKGVETLHHRRLQREMDVYNKLDAQQGLLIPVCLGIVRLLLPYPMVDCTLVTHMLLMSYAGEPLHWQPLRQKLERTGINVDKEERRTIRDLRALGLTDEDDISNGNIMWCAETNRAMKIDFDQAYVSTTGANSSQVQETMVSLTSGLKAAIDSPLPWATYNLV